LFSIFLIIFAIYFDSHISYLNFIVGIGFDGMN